VPTHVRYPSTIGGAFYIVVLLATVAGLVVVLVSDDWRLGVRVMGGALAASAGARLVIPQKDAGMLAVRHRLFDFLLVGGTSAALFVLASNIPDQPL